MMAKTTWLANVLVLALLASAHPETLILRDDAAGDEGDGRTMASIAGCCVGD